MFHIFYPSISKPDASSDPELKSKVSELLKSVVEVIHNFTVDNVSDMNIWVQKLTQKSINDLVHFEETNEGDTDDYNSSQASSYTRKK